MLICTICDLHLPYNKNAIQYDVLDWACEDIKKKKADAVIFAGDFTADGNIFAAKRFVRKIQGLNIPAVVITGNSDCRTPKNTTLIKEMASSPCINKIGEYTVIAINDGEKSISDEEFDSLENAKGKIIVVMHHPSSALKSSDRERFKKWRGGNPDAVVFFGHLHVSERNGNDICLQAADPDKAIGENPCITYYDTETDELRKAYYFCAVPNDIYRFIGITCNNPAADLEYAIEKSIKCIELPLSINEEEIPQITELLARWRKSGGTNLSLIAPEVFYSDDDVYNNAEWDSFIRFATVVNADRITLKVPAVSVDTVRKDKMVLDNIADFLAKKFVMLPEKCIIGVENMHMTSGDSDDDTRRFGYIPEECAEFMKHLQKKCTKRVGICLNTGNARNNAPFSQKFTLGVWYSELGRYTVGYRIHQVENTPTGFVGNKPITDIYGSLISYASFFREWSEGIICKAPVILDIKGEDKPYAETYELFERIKNKNIFDLHSHTLFSNCGRDKPERLINTAIVNGVKLFGICDHNYGIGARKPLYLKKIRDLAPKFADRIKLLCGIEVSTLPDYYDIKSTEELAGFDYILLENLTDDRSMVGSSLLDYAKSVPVKCGIAHTDMFEYCKKYGYNPEDFFKKMAEHGIFWEMNVSYDSIHHYREHGYVKDFMTDSEKQRIVKESGLAISVGFDSHRCEDYDGFKVHEMYDFLKENGIKTADELFN